MSTCSKLRNVPKTYLHAARPSFPSIPSKIPEAIKDPKALLIRPPQESNAVLSISFNIAVPRLAAVKHKYTFGQVHISCTILIEEIVIQGKKQLPQTQERSV
jgi:hypothetical protein